MPDGITTNVAATSSSLPYFNIAQAYANMVNGMDMAADYSSTSALGNLSGLNSFNPLSMNGSIMPYGTNSFYGYGPGSETMNMTQEQYLTYQGKLQAQQMQQQVDLQKKANALKVTANAEENEITRDAGELQRLIKENRQDKIEEAYAKLQNAVKKKLEEAGCATSDNERVKAEADLAYYNATGTNLLDDIESNGKSSFEYGFLRGTGVGCLFTDKGDNRDQTIANITGTARSNSSKSWETVGRVVGATLTLAAAVIGIAALKRGGKATVTGIGKGLKRIWSGPDASSLESLVKKQNILEGQLPALRETLIDAHSIKISTGKNRIAEFDKFISNPANASLQGVTDYVNLTEQYKNLKLQVSQARITSVTQRINAKV